MVDKDGKIVPVNLADSATAWGPRFIWKGTTLYQQSALSRT